VWRRVVAEVAGTTPSVQVCACWGGSWVDSGALGGPWGLVGQLGTDLGGPWSILGSVLGTKNIASKTLFGNYVKNAKTQKV
jgi:hypothetical protein